MELRKEYSSKSTYICTYGLCNNEYVRTVDEQQISSCSSLHKLIGALNTGGKPSLITVYEEWGGGKLIFLLPRTAAIYIDCGAASDIFSAHAGT
jgi:hypothetical protein